MRTTEKNFSLEGGLKALAEPTRLTILSLLAKYGDLCVGQLVEALKLPQAGVSQHLRVLRYQGIVKVSKQGQWAYYSMIPERIANIANKLESIPKGVYQIPDHVCKSIECSMLPHPKNEKIIKADSVTA